MKRKEKRQLKAEKRAQRKIAKNVESEAAVRETSIEPWTENEDQPDGSGT
jgi:hypothetical protein